MTITKRGRDARNGQFIPISEAKRRKATTVVESVKSKRKPRKTKLK